ncbi:MAG TPA: hypothetical protein VGF66_11295 [Gaiellaceae bacterium]|jgi:hypothetical protein
MTANDTSEVLRACERARAEHQRSQEHEPRPDRRPRAVAHGRHRPRSRQGTLAASRIGGDDSLIDGLRGTGPWM